MLRFFYINFVCECVLLKFLFDYSGDLFPIATFHVVIKQEESFKIIKTINTIGKLCLFSRKHIWLQSIWSAQTQASIGMNNKLLETFCLLFAFYYLCFYLPYLTEGKMLFSIYICQFSSKIVNIFAISFGYDVVCVFLFCYLQICQLNSPWQYRLAYRKVCSLWNDCFGVFRLGRTAIRRTISSLLSNCSSGKKWSRKAWTDKKGTAYTSTQINSI